MFDRTLKLKLAGIFLFFLYMLVHYDEAMQNLVFDTEEAIFSTYGYISFLFAAASLGVIFSAAVYNLAFYAYNRDTRYLYYSLAQGSMLVFLISLDALYIRPFTDFFPFKSIFIHDLSQIMIVIFSLLFSNKFLNLPKTAPLLYRIVQAIILLMLLDMLILLFLGHGILVRLLPPYIFIWLIVSESKRFIHHKNRAYWFFYYGWYFVIVMAILVYTDLVHYIHDDFPYLHITVAVEAMVMSLAISYQMRLLQEEKEAQQSLLLQQSRLASMGEMISIVAHQWKQPLTRLGYTMMHLKKALKENDKALQKVEEGKEQIRYMANTIETFRTFYNPAKQKEHFSLARALHETVQIATLENIETTILNQKDCTLYGNKNELQQALLNLLNNAKEAFRQNQIPHPTLKITVDAPKIVIEDNAGGIPKALQQKIFEPYFSTKKGGDGIGLYIVKLIIEQELQATITLQSESEGSTFTITFNQNCQKK